MWDIHYPEQIDTIGITFVLLGSNFVTLKNTLDCVPPPSPDPLKPSRH